MNYNPNRTGPARKQLERRLAPLRRMEGLAPPARGWLRALREAFGMTTAQLAQRIGVSQPRVVRLQRAEAEGGVTLRTLRQAAEAMDCTLVYALVPNKPLNEMVLERARKVADAQLERTHHSMKLEDQALESRDLEAERKRLLDELLRGDPSRLWDRP